MVQRPRPPLSACTSSAPETGRKGDRDSSPNPVSNWRRIAFGRRRSSLAADRVNTMRYAPSVRSAFSKLAQGDPGLLSQPTIHLVQKLLSRILFDEFEDDVSVRLSPGLVLRQSLTNEDGDGDGCSRGVRRHG